MATPCWCFLSSLLFAMVAVTQTVDAITESIKNTASEHFARNPITHPSGRHQRKLGALSKALDAGQPRNKPQHLMIKSLHDRPELKGFSPVCVEMGLRDKGNIGGHRERAFQGHGCLALEQKNVSPDSEMRVKGKRCHSAFAGHRTLALCGREDTTVSYDRSISSVTTVTREEHSSPPSLPSDLQEDSSLDKNVVSILGREFFHWDDWESARLMEKKNRQHIKSSSNGKQAMHLQTIISCEHHLDCVPEVGYVTGSCCNLRKHMCEVQNRGLNNKCYDNCMCKRGFQCLAKLHHNDRVIQKKGRCVHPEDINISHRIFTAI
ncbi:hypothetical protein P4O66_022421 [Electrophorus voltai]|uniref:Dickkopf N-terminal cysteine-rich domain-containing protein n=1 Tax=Electrophorus voltai TaxID=2609070 RepID=A0AAD8ZMW6_9TELE|nr:hypothetical protein P4O66_022421 [Electrophorus voltai]